VKKTFASDNYAGVHPEIMAALAEANHGHEGSYGADKYTAEAEARFKSMFGAQTEVFFVYNGTGANVLALSAMTRSYMAVICPELAHINVDESTAPEKFTGCKLITVPAPDGKLRPEQIESRVIRVGDQHHPQARVVSISQSTEYGTLYTAEEVRAIADTAHRHGLLLHMDGSRISNAAAALELDFKSFTSEAGVDVLSFGGTKNGLMFGEAVVFFNAGLSKEFQFQRKQGMQLHSKMRFIAAQFNALLRNDLWKRNALHANRMAARLAEGLAGIRGVKLTQKVQANGIFAVLPSQVIPKIQEHTFFYVWNDATSEIRLMCSWDTTEEDVENFIGVVRSVMNDRI
jgi:threonine aldolase